MSVANAKSMRPTVTMYWPPGMLCPNAAELMAPSDIMGSACHSPEVMITRPVMVHMTMVSKNTSKVPHRPWRAGWSVSAEACAMGAEPMPASWVNTPRDMPTRHAYMTVAPKKPPVAAVPVKASRKIWAIAAGISAAFTTSTAAAPAR